MDFYAKNRTNNIRLKCFFTGLFCLLLIACKSEEKKGKVVAKVGEYKLYLGELEQLVDESNTVYQEMDSTAQYDAVKENWIKKMILVEKANQSKSLNLNFIERRAEDFKHELMVHQFMEEEVLKRLDTTISPKELEKYYTDHKEEFQLNDYLVKVLYLKIPLDAPDIESIGQSYKLYKESDLANIEAYAQMYASNFYYDLNSWIYFDDLLKEIPLQDIRKDKFILKRSKIRFEENGFNYFLNIVDYKLKNTISPLSFEKNNIKQRIINTRTKQLREEIKNELIKNAYEQSLVKEY